MTPYTLRERRENIAQHGPEAYRGQRERLLASLVEYDAERAAVEADLAVIARIGGNVYRSIDMMPHSRRWDDDTYHASARAGVQNVQNNRKASRRAQLPEAAFDWPVYRAATLAEVYGALWGQASPAEERVLDTLAHCAGLPVTMTPSPDSPESELRVLDGNR